MFRTLQITAGTNFVHAVTETTLPLTDIVQGKEFRPVSDAYEVAAKACGNFHDPVSSKVYKDDQMKVLVDIGKIALTPITVQAQIDTLAVTKDGP